MTILKEQVGAILGNRAEYETAGDYYEGEVAETFATKALKVAMRNTGYRASLNFCRPVVDAVHNRLEVKAVLGVSDTSTKIIGDVWENNQLGLDADEIHRRALVFGDCFVMVWPDASGELEISYNTPLTTAIVYDPESPRTKLYAVKMWESGSETRLNVYYPESIQKYRAQGTAVTDGVQWSLMETVENPFGEVPVFHFRTERPFGRPEHKDSYDAQNYINKMFITSMFVADYQGAPQRYALRSLGDGAALENADFKTGDTDRENATALRNGPGQLWDLAGYAEIGQFDPADPNVFWNPIKDTVRAMASTTNTPLHYFEKTGNVPSGEALRVAEAPLIKKVHRRQASFGQTWREVFKFVLRTYGIEEDVQVKWAEVESLDVLERLDASLKKRNIGLSVAQVMREDGYDDEVINRVLLEAKSELDEGTASDYPRARVQEQNDERNVA